MSGSAKRTINLSSKKRAVLKAWLREQGIGADHVETITRRRDEGPAPLSFAQQRLWFFNQLEPGNPLYNIHAAVSLRGPLNVPVLCQSLNEIQRRHEVLRTTFAVVAGHPVQIVNEAACFKLPVIDLQALDERARCEKVSARAEEESRYPFNLTSEPLLRTQLLRLDESEHVLLLTMHHIVSDGWSMGIFVRELAALYEAYLSSRPSPLAELPIQYADFAAWQREWLQGERLETQLAYWREQLAGSPPLLALPTDRPRPPVQAYTGGHEALRLTESLSRALKELSRREGVTLFMTLLAAFACLLYRYSGQTDILVGTPIANRQRAELENLIGFFVNTLVLRVRCGVGLSFRTLLKQVRETALEAYAHQDLPFEKLVEELQPERTLSHSPLFQVMLDLQNAPMRDMQLAGLHLTPLPFDSRRAKFDLTLTMGETEEALSGSLEYNTDLFEAATIKRLSAHFQRLLAAIVASPDEQLARLPLLSAEERAQILFDWNETRTIDGTAECIHELFEQQAARTPEAIALVTQGERLSYRELNERANKLAHHLQKLGTGPETLTGICLTRSAEVITAILGVLKAGGAYLPLDPQQPAARLSFMLTDAGARVLLTQPSLPGAMPEQSTQLVYPDRDWPAIASESAAKPQQRVLADSPAYVIYTSGSTGRPKGVVVSQRSLAHSTCARFAYYREPVNSFLLLSSFIFDSSIAGLFWTLCQGGMLVIPDEAARQDPAHLATLVARHSISHLLGLPALYDLLLQQAEARQLASLRVVIVAGESCPAQLVRRHNEALPHVALFNEYGPTEATVWSSVYHCRTAPDERPVPIGRPIAQTQIYLLDPELQPVPIGVAGELYIGGAGLARGYCNDPALTAARFLPNPFSRTPGARLYRTGDLARYRQDGEIEFIGRNDFQVKLRGRRIELAEIEHALAQHPHVQEAVIVARKQRAGDMRLVAYVVLDQAAAVAAKQLREFLKEKLPAYMLPAAFVLLDALPRTATGKLDRAALPIEQSGAEIEGSYVAPQTALEQVLTIIFAEVLEVEQVGIYDNFFELGGHSLLATQVVARTRAALQVEVALRQLFAQPTVAGLAQVLAAAGEAAQLERTAELLLRLSKLSDKEIDSLLEETIGSVKEG